jgi:phospholipid/cholesterol/gamma-HCH transport system substrate-binding protein
MDWMRDLGRIANSVSEITSRGELRDIVTNVQAAVVKINAVVSRIERGEGTVGKLLSSDDSVYEDIKETVATARTAVVSVNDTFTSAKAIAARIERGEGTVGKLLSSDDTVYRDLKGSLENVRSVTERIKNGNGLLMKLAEDGKLSEDASALVERLAAASSDLATVAARLQKGEGTLGKLSADSKLYDEVTALVKDIRQVVDNYRDTTPISSFGSLIGGAL